MVKRKKANLILTCFRKTVFFAHSIRMKRPRGHIPEIEIIATTMFDAFTPRPELGLAKRGHEDPQDMFSKRAKAIGIRGTIFLISGFQAGLEWRDRNTGKKLPQSKDWAREFSIPATETQKDKTIFPSQYLVKKQSLRESSRKSIEKCLCSRDTTNTDEWIEYLKTMPECFEQFKRGRL